MYEQAIRSLPFNVRTGTNTLKPSPGGKQSARFSYNTVSQGKRREALFSGGSKRTDTMDLVIKCKESLNSLMEGTPDAQTAETRQPNGKKSIKERFYMYSEEYSPLVQFMHLEHSHRKIKRPRSPRNGMHVKQQSEDWSTNLLDHLNSQQVHDEGIVFKSRTANTDGETF
jgi:hypothetical protein